MARIPLADHIRLRLCSQPRASQRYAARLWICPECHLAWVTTRAMDPRYTPDQGISWRWILWEPGTAPGGGRP